MHSQGNHMSRRAGQSFVAIVGAFVIISVLSYYAWSLSSENGSLKRTIVLTYSKLKDLKTQKGTLEKKNSLLSNRMVEMEESRDTEKENAENEQQKKKDCEAKNIRIEGEWKNKVNKKQELLKECEDVSTQREKLLIDALSDVKLESVDFAAQSDIVLAKVKYLKEKLKSTNLEYINFQNKYSDLEKEKIRLEELIQRKPDIKVPSNIASKPKKQEHVHTSQKNDDARKDDNQGKKTRKNVKKDGLKGGHNLKAEKNRVKKEMDDKEANKDNIIGDKGNLTSQTESSLNTPTPSGSTDGDTMTPNGHKDLEKTQKHLPVPNELNSATVGISHIDPSNEADTEQQSDLIDDRKKQSKQKQKEQDDESNNEDEKRSSEEGVKQVNSIPGKNEIEQQDNADDDKRIDIML